MFVCVGVCVCVWVRQEDEYLSGFLNSIPLLISPLQTLSLSYHSSAVALLYRLYARRSTQRSSGDSSVHSAVLSILSQDCMLCFSSSAISVNSLSFRRLSNLRGSRKKSPGGRSI